MKSERLIMRIDPLLDGEILTAAERGGTNKSAWVESAIRLRLELERLARRGDVESKRALEVLDARSDGASA